MEQPTGRPLSELNIKVKQALLSGVPETSVESGFVWWSILQGIWLITGARKGHILLCLEGELHTELKDGRKFLLKPGMSYQVADNAEPHRSFAPIGATLFIVD